MTQEAPPSVLKESLEILEAVEKRNPALYRAVYPRIYREPKRSSYYSPKHVASQLVQIALNIQTGMHGLSEQLEFMFASALAKYRVPTYYIGLGLMEALSKTALPGKINWLNMELPFPAAVFLPPKGTLRHPEQGDILFIGYVRLDAGVDEPSPIDRHYRYQSSDGGMMIVAASASGYLYHWNISEAKMGPEINLTELGEIMGRKAPTHISAQPGGADKMNDADHAMMVQAAHYMFSTLLVMTARPTLLLRGQMEKRVRNKRSEIREFWTPMVIGENYRVRYLKPDMEQAEGTHASPRLHWVPGFTRQQAYGPKWALRKTIWVEPFLRGGHEDDE